MSSTLRSSRLILAFAYVGFGSACSLSTDSETPPVIPLEEQQWGSSLNIDLSTMTKLPSGVYIKETLVGTGATVSGTPTVSFYYTGFLASGFVFDTNIGAAQPLQYGLSELIPGFNSGMQGMKVGGKRRLIIPSALAYGAGSQGAIPPNANLVFDIELVGII